MHHTSIHSSESTHEQPVEERTLLEWNDLSFIIPAPQPWFQRKYLKRWSKKTQNRTNDIPLSSFPMRDRSSMTTDTQDPIQPPSQHRILLNRVSGRVLPGELVAMMGASGAGKSTLLNILAGRFTGKGKLYGSITINGQSSSNSWRSLIGYVEQSDLMYPHLTVEETITTSALLRLDDAKYTHKQKLERVEKVISVLGLHLVRQNRVGEDGPSRISGGERKRVSIGK